MFFGHSIKKGPFSRVNLTVKDCRTVCISGKVRDRIVCAFIHLFFRLIYWCKIFDLYIPVLTVAYIQQFLPLIRVSESFRIIDKGKPVVFLQLFQTIHELAAEETLYCLYREKKLLERQRLNRFLSGVSPPLETRT